MCLNLCIFSAILLGILYLFFGAFELVFSHVYGFGLWQCGCTFLGLLVGMVCAILTDPLWRRNYARLERNHQEKVGRTDDPQPEWRLPPGMLCNFTSFSIGIAVFFLVRLLTLTVPIISDWGRTSCYNWDVHLRMDNLP